MQNVQMMQKDQMVQKEQRVQKIPQSHTDGTKPWRTDLPLHAERTDRAHDAQAGGAGRAADIRPATVQRPGKSATG
jgi:hypothetical protein